MSTANSAPYKAAQAAARTRSRTVTLLQPTLPERINRLNPAERHELGQVIRSLKLRKTIKRTLHEAFQQGEMRKFQEQMTLLRRLKSAARTPESMTNYERTLTALSDATTYEPTIKGAQP